jgi:uncharacterized Fe-S cluster-containing radical SAM superfamily enzyme
MRQYRLLANLDGHGAPLIYYILGNNIQDAEERFRVQHPEANVYSIRLEQTNP